MRKNHDIGTIIIAVFFDFLVIFNILNHLDVCREVSKEELNSVTGNIEYVEFGLGRRHTEEILLTVNSEIYVFFSKQHDSDSFYALYESIKTSDNVNLIYKKELRGLLLRNTIVELIINGEPIQTIEEHNEFHKGSATFTIIWLIIVLIINVLSIGFSLVMKRIMLRKR